MNRPHAGCRITVVIPAKNEASAICAALAGFAAQRDVDFDAFEILVFANDCTDDTAELARRFARREPRLAVTVVSAALDPVAAHVGTARREALRLAVARQRALVDGGIVGSTDADSVVDPYWIARTLTEFAGDVDVVAGHVEIARDERDAMEAPLRLLYDRERAYRRALGEIEARFDPRPFDPPSRHDSFVGASFAVRVRTYLAAGGIPALPRLEDVAFAYALRRIDARIRHSYDVRVATSGRRLARVEGGFGSFIEDLRARGSRRETFLVDSAERSILRAKARAAVRSYWSDPANANALSATARAYGLETKTAFALVDPRAPFGETLDRFEATAPPFERMPPEPVDRAIATLRAALAASARVSIEHEYEATTAG